MTITSEIKTSYVRGAKTITPTLHIRLGESITLEKGDTIILHSTKAGKIEIKRKPATPVPYYALLDN